MNSTTVPTIVTTTQLAQLVEELSQRAETTTTNISQGLLIVVSSLIFFMQAGFAFLESGAVRAGKEKPVLFKNFLVLCVGNLAFWATGFAFGYGGTNPFIGDRYFFLINLGQNNYVLWLSNFVFAATTSTIATGALAERAKLVSYLVLSFFIAGLIHPVVAHWAWTEDGWLASGIKVDNVTVTYADFAGSGVVHVTGGAAAFLGAIVLGARIGRFNDMGQPVPIEEKTTSTSALGGFILFFGFLLFISGRNRSVTRTQDTITVGRISVNTLLAGSAGAITSLIFVAVISRKQKSNRDSQLLVATLNGCLAGLVAICAGADSVHAYAAIIIGIVAGLSHRSWTKVILKWKIDDPVESVSVHLGAGIWGVIAVGFFDFNRGLLYNWTRASVVQLMWNVVGLLAIIAWTAATSAILFGVLHTFNLLHLSRADELKGLEGSSWSRAAAVSGEKTNAMTRRRRRMQKQRSSVEEEAASVDEEKKESRGDSVSTTAV
ncbi:putative ammonium transporter 1 [Oscarella lobularis]|uniref:putative ammonium transporter 1 n=1 Tax=Oscarella lobularis TaxID=121494 RepID=UPI0033136FDD